MLVRVLKAIRNYPDNKNDLLFNEGDIFIEHGIAKGKFYPEGLEDEPQCIDGEGLEIDKVFIHKGGKDRWFEELTPIQFKETVWYKNMKTIWLEERKSNKNQIKYLEKRNEEINILISFDDV